MTYLISYTGTLESNTITTEHDLFCFLLHHARKHTFKRTYRKGIANFADEVIGALMAGRDLDDLKNPGPDEQSLLSLTLHDVSAEMTPHHQALIEFAVRIYERDGVDMEIANRVLIEILELGGTQVRHYFEQTREKSEGSLGTEMYLVSTPLFREECGQEVRIRQRNGYGDIRWADQPMEPRTSRVGEAQ